MAFVPEYEHDIFVSYAHVDDQPFIDAATANGWVATLVRYLKNELAQKVGRADAVSVWLDAHNLRGHHPLNDEIAIQLERTALLVAILSPGYVASDWCQQEARLFADFGRRSRPPRLCRRKGAARGRRTAREPVRPPRL